MFRSASLVIAAALGVVLITAGCGGSAAPTGQSGSQAKQPDVIHIGSGSSGTGAPQTGATMGIVQHQQLLEKEFSKDGIKTSWSFFKGLGPAQNEGFANNTLDFGYQGDLSAIIGRAGGLKVKVLAATCVRQNNYIGVRADSTIHSIEDLKGKRLAVQIGGPTFMFLNRLLESQGFSQRDVTIYNLSGAAAVAAIQSKQADAVFGTNLLDLAGQSEIKVIYNTRDGPDMWTNVGVLVATEDFINRYPQVTQRVVKQWVAAAAWGSQDENRKALFGIWALGGTPVGTWEREYAGRSGPWITTPLLDPFLYEHLRQDVELSKRIGIIKTTFNVDEWVDPRFLQQALQDLALENHWLRYDRNGKEIGK
jgi:sulfonate transport system substrate-binding protein